MYRFSLLALFIALLFSCSDNNSSPTIDGSIYIAEDSLCLSVGDSYQIEAQSEEEISYLVLNDYYATVNSTGLLKAKEVGSTIVALSTSKHSAEIALEVIAPEILFLTPDFDFGMSQTEIIDKYGEPDNTSGTVYAYTDSSYNSQLFFHFDDMDETEAISQFVFAKDSAELANYLEYLYDFELYSPESSYAIYYNKDRTVQVSFYTKQYEAGYFFLNYQATDWDSKQKYFSIPLGAKMELDNYFLNQ